MSKTHFDSKGRLWADSRATACGARVTDVTATTDHTKVDCRRCAPMVREQERFEAWAAENGVEVA